MATKLPVTVFKYAPRAWSSTTGTFVQLFLVWHVESGHTWTTERVELREQKFARKFDYSFLYLLGLEDQFSTTEDAIVHLDTF